MQAVTWPSKYLKTTESRVTKPAHRRCPVDNISSWKMGVFLSFFQQFFLKLCLLFLTRFYFFRPKIALVSCGWYSTGTGLGSGVGMRKPREARNVRLRHMCKNLNTFAVFLQLYKPKKRLSLAFSFSHPVWLATGGNFRRVENAHKDAKENFQPSWDGDTNFWSRRQHYQLFLGDSS